MLNGKPIELTLLSKRGSLMGPKKVNIWAGPINIVCRISQYNGILGKPTSSEFGYSVFLSLKKRCPE